MPERLSREDYPGIGPEEVGRLPNIGYGSVEGVRAHLIQGGATALLSEDISAEQTSFSVDDASRFPPAPFTVQLASEKMLVGALSGETMSSVARGYDGTRASAHGRGRTVFEVRTEYIYLLSAEPVTSIGQVYVDGKRQSTGYAGYTGQTGDEHPDFPGKAVIAFSAIPYINSQRNPEGGGQRTSTEEAEVAAASHMELVDGTSSGVPLGLKANQKAWAAFRGSGDVIGQSYTASVRNLGSEDGVLRAVVKNGSLLRDEEVLIPGGSTRTVELAIEGGGADSVFSLIMHGLGGSFQVLGMESAVTVSRPPEDEGLESFAPPVKASSLAGSGLRDSSLLKPGGRALAWASYPATSLGLIHSQRHVAVVRNTGGGGARVRLAALGDPGAASVAECAIGAGDQETVSTGYQGGGWHDMTKLAVASGEVRVEGLHKEVSYVPAAGGSPPAERPLATASARVVIGAVVSADAHWSLDDTGDYGGAGTVIERPDHVIRHFLVRRLGFSPSDIDADSFSAAGSAYSSAIEGGYRFAFIIDSEIKPSAFLKNLAFQCRSTLKYQGGTWRLDFLPDAAPTPVKTLRRDELAGESAAFTFKKTPTVDIANDLTARFRRNYLESSSWLESVEKADSASIAKYGACPAVYEFDAIRLSAMAEDVLGHLLLQRKVPLLVAEFPVFWEHFGLQPGDTVGIENPLWGGRKFSVERVRRLDRFRAEVRALEWWQ